jgi:predicted nucleic acid-binding protein
MRYLLDANILSDLVRQEQIAPLVKAFESWAWPASKPFAPCRAGEGHGLYA